MNQEKKNYRIVMLLENEGYPEDCRVLLEALTLHDAGHRVSVICPKMGVYTKTYELLDGIHVYRYLAPREFEGVLGYAWEFGYSFVMAMSISFYILIRHGLDVIHIHMPPDLNGLIGVFYRLIGKQFVMDHHDLSPELYAAQGGSNGLLRGLLLRFEKISCRWANRLISTNSTQRMTQIQRAGAKPEHCGIVRNGPADFFMEDHQPFDYEIPEGTKVIGYVGVMGPQDGVDSLVRSLHVLKTDLGRIDFIGIIVGTGSALPGLKKLVRELNLTEHVRFTGFIAFKDVPSYIAGFDICATPDPSNPYNDSCTTIKTMEYMAMYKPTVAFDTDENRITARESAIYVNDNDEHGFAVALASLMNNATQCAALGAIGRQRVEGGLSWEQQQKKLLAVYESLGAHPGSFDLTVDATDCFLIEQSGVSSEAHTDTPKDEQLTCTEEPLNL